MKEKSEVSGLHVSEIQSQKRKRHKCQITLRINQMFCRLIQSLSDK